VLKIGTAGHHLLQGMWTFLRRISFSYLSVEGSCENHVLWFAFSVMVKINSCYLTKKSNVEVSGKEDLTSNFNCCPQSMMSHIFHTGHNPLAGKGTTTPAMQSTTIKHLIDNTSEIFLHVHVNVAG